MPATVQVLVDAAINELSQVPGSSTQIYATSRILQYVQDAFDFCFQATWWAAYTSYWRGTLDGTTGRLTADIAPLTPTSGVPISTHTNIGSCFADGSNKIIRLLPPRSNPFMFDQSSPGYPLYMVPDYTYPYRPVQFYPTNATGDVIMEVRQEPEHPFSLLDTLYLDQLMLMLGACYMYAADDGTNPGQINKFQSMFMKRLNDMVGAENQTPIQLDPRMRDGTNEWMEMP
jgi:hypothetical protein